MELTWLTGIAGGVGIILVKWVAHEVAARRLIRAWPGRGVTNWRVVMWWRIGSELGCLAGWMAVVVGMNWLGVGKLDIAVGLLVFPVCRLLSWYVTIRVVFKPRGRERWRAERHTLFGFFWSYLTDIPAMILSGPLIILWIYTYWAWLFLLGEGGWR